jgi:DNA-binding HxlR family transcriptional regulator|tara:strand:- start:4195 stop:5172 length:978 start_codon:yes stop_codon:yes gene_type:complete
LEVASKPLSNSSNVVVGANSGSANGFTTRASSINRALDQIGDKWCLLILQEVFWGVNTFTPMLQGTGASKGVLSDRLLWLQNIDCLRKDCSARHPVYHLTKKSIELYQNGLMAMVWERTYFSSPELDKVELVHNGCGKAFWPVMQCSSCDDAVRSKDIQFSPGLGAGVDQRVTKTRRRSSTTSDNQNHSKTLYNNLINLLGDRWTANLVALAFHGLKRFDEFHQELPVATNILADRLKLLINEGIFSQQPYQHSPLRYEYHLTDKGRDLFPYFVTLLSWGNKHCSTEAGDPMALTHNPCGNPLKAQVRCNQCFDVLVATEVHFKL